MKKINKNLNEVNNKLTNTDVPPNIGHNPSLIPYIQSELIEFNSLSVVVRLLNLKL